MIEFKNVSKKIKKNIILNSINLNLPSKGIVAAMQYRPGLSAGNNPPASLSSPHG